jgi:molybdopterin adenylyltransferase
MSQMQIGLLIISDRSSRGERSDATIPLLTEELIRLNWNIKITTIIPDDINVISEKLIEWVDQFSLNIIFTSGGTGFSPRDITPEATKLVLEREAPGLAEVMRATSLKATPHAMLSRAVAGIRKSTIIINLPGNPNAALENFRAISIVLPHAVDLINDTPTSEAGHKINKGI